MNLSPVLSEFLSKYAPIWSKILKRTKSIKALRCGKDALRMYGCEICIVGESRGVKYFDEESSVYCKACVEHGNSIAFEMVAGRDDRKFQFEMELYRRHLLANHRH